MPNLSKRLDNLEAETERQKQERWDAFISQFTFDELVTLGLYPDQADPDLWERWEPVFSMTWPAWVVESVRKSEAGEIDSKAEIERILDAR